MLSARIERAEFPVQRKRTLNTRSGVVLSGMGVVLGGNATGSECGECRVANVGMSLAAVVHEKSYEAGQRRIGGAVNDRATFAARRDEAGLFEVARSEEHT